MTNDKKLKRSPFPVIAAVSILTAFWAIVDRPLGSHEAYVAVAARGMVNSGNWLIPYFNGEPRLQKTPLGYWLVAAAAKAAGSVNDFVVRLPSAALAVLSAIAVFYFVSDWLGWRTGVLSALIWSTSLCYIRYSHTGRPEMALTAFVTIAMLSFYSAVKANERKRQIYCMLIFWLSVSLAMLVKGPAPLPLIFPALFFYFAVFRRWKLIPKLLPIAGAILFLFIFLPWPIAVLLKQPAAIEIWKDEFLGRAVGEYAAGSKPFYYYFGIIFVYFLPFSAFIPLALAAPFYRIWEKKREVIFYLWFWFVVGVVVMSFCGGKRQHYILPLMPAAAVLAGIIIDDMIFVSKVYSQWFVAIFSIGHLFAVITVVTGVVICLMRAQHHLRNFIMYISLVTVILAFYISILFLLNKRVVATVSLFAILCVFILTWPVLEDKGTDENYIIRDFADRVAAAAADKPVIAYCKINPSFIYYFGHDIPVVCDIDEIYARYSAGCGIIAAGDNFEQLKEDGRLRLFAIGLDEGRGLFVKDEKNE
jgi:4-amino-4-deoxy-L-arabinose transferase-like glycosyltransferase